jgi:hypothetical protein
MSDVHVEHRGGGRVFFGLLLGAALVTSAWLALGLPRVEIEGGIPPAEGWVAVHDAAQALPKSIVDELERRAERFRRRRGVEVEVHTAPRDAGDGWVDEVARRRLVGLEDGRPRALVLVARDPMWVAVRANQGLEAVLGASFKDRLAAHVAPALRNRRVDLAARRGLYRVVGAVGDHLDGGRSRGWAEVRIRRWPRRRGGRTDAEWHALTAKGFGGLVLLGVLGLLSTRAGRRALQGSDSSVERPRSGWFRGAGDAGGFGGGARAGRKPRPGW